MPSINRLLSDNIPVDPSKNTFTGNGSQTVFNLTGQIAAGSTNPSNLIVSLDGAIQEPGDDYSINNSTLTFTTAPDSGAKVVIVSRNSPFTYATNLPGDGTVTSAKIVAGNVTPDKLSTGAPFWNSSSNVALGHSSPATNLHLNYANYGAILFGNNNANGFHITKESSDNTFNIWSGAIGSGTNRLRIMPSGNIGLGGIDAQARVHLRGNSVGTAIGNNSAGLWLETTNPHQSILEIEDYRVANGNSWGTAGYRIQQRTDASFQAYIQFNGNNDHGISIGTGSSTLNGHSVPERIRITQDGTIDVRNNPIVNCASVADAWVMAAPWDVRSNVIAPNNTRIRPIAGTNFVEWEFDPINTWTDSSVGLVYYINRSSTLEPFAGVNAVSRPNGLAGVRLQLVEIIQNAPKSIMRCRLMDGPVTNIQTLFGTGGGNGFLYSTNGIIDSYNVSNFIKYGTGDYAITFVNNMADRNYAAVGCAGHHYTGGGALILSFDNTNVTAVAPNLQNYQRRTSSLIRFTTRYVVNNAVYDPHNLSVVIFGSSLQDNF